MWLLKRSNKVSVIVVSMVAAVAHNSAQVVVATLLLETPAILLNLPFLAVVACATGFATGTAALGVIKALQSHIATGSPRLHTKTGSPCAIPGSPYDLPGKESQPLPKESATQ
jgi:ABC-type transport system involved in cytochrome c biogenesis permease component